MKRSLRELLREIPKQSYDNVTANVVQRPQKYGFDFGPSGYSVEDIERWYSRLSSVEQKMFYESVARIANRPRMDDLKAELNSLTKRQLQSLDGYDAPVPEIREIHVWGNTKPEIIERAARWAAGQDLVDETIKAVRMLTGEKQFAQQEKAQRYEENLRLLNRYMPEWKQVLDSFGYSGPPPKPRKFVESVKVFVTPAPFNPTAMGDFDMRHTFFWDSQNKTLVSGPSYSYDSMTTVAGRAGIHERTVELPRPGDRFWDVVWSGQWGGYWHTVRVYVRRDGLPPAALQLKGG